MLNRVKKLSIALGWRAPFFAIPIARVRFVVDETGEKTKTAAVSASGTIFLFPSFVNQLTDHELTFIIAHEVMHCVMRHAARRGQRNAKKWNIATDMAINAALRAAQIGTAPTQALFPAHGQVSWSSERIYDAISDNTHADGEACRGCGSVDIDPEADREWIEIAVQAAAMGNEASASLVQCCEIPPAGISWNAILRRGVAIAIAAHGRDFQTWTRRGRRSAPIGPQFPGWQCGPARVGIIIDTSGSMTNDMLAQCVGETLAIAKATQADFYLITHDAVVQWEGWLSPTVNAAAIIDSLKGRGGTNAAEAYAAIEKAHRKFDAVIHLTDGELRWPTWPRNANKMILALTSNNSNTPPPGAMVLEIKR